MTAVFVAKERKIGGEVERREIARPIGLQFWRAVFSAAKLKISTSAGSEMADLCERFLRHRSLRSEAQPQRDCRNSVTGCAARCGNCRSQMFDILNEVIA